LKSVLIFLHIIFSLTLIAEVIHRTILDVKYSNVSQVQTQFAKLRRDSERSHGPLSGC
jgi:hypothetical protein